MARQTVPAQGHALPRVTRDRANDVLADGPERQRRNARADRVDTVQVGREVPYHGRRQHREARSSRQAEHAGGARLRVQDADTRDEVRGVREIEIMNARGDARLDEAVTAVAVALKRPARVDHDGRGERGKLRRGVRVAIERRRLEAGLRPAASNEILGTAQRTTRNDQRQAGLVLEQRDDSAAENTVAADDEDAKLTHEAIQIMERDRCAPQRARR